MIDLPLEDVDGRPLPEKTIQSHVELIMSALVSTLGGVPVIDYQLRSAPDLGDTVPTRVVSVMVSCPRDRLVGFGLEHGLWLHQMALRLRVRGIALVWEPSH